MTTDNAATMRRPGDPLVAFVVRILTGILTSLYVLLKVLPASWVLTIIAKLPFSRWLHSLSDPIDAVAYAMQVVAMTLLLWPCWRVKARIASQEGEGKRLALAASNQFRKFWVCLVAMWLFFYLALFLRPFVGNRQPVWDTVIDSLNNLQGMFLFFCYWVLTAITVSEDNKQPRRPIPVVPLVSGVFLFFVADVTFTATHVALPADAQIRMIFRLLSGLWVGVCMGLLTGCLESEYLQVVGDRIPTPRRLIICSLYLYAVLQVAYVGFLLGPEQEPGLALVGHFASILSLPLKLLFVGLCYWLLQEGRLEFYMKKTRYAIENTDKEWRTFGGLDEENHV